MNNRELNKKIEQYFASDVSGRHQNCRRRGHPGRLPPPDKLFWDEESRIPTPLFGWNRKFPKSYEELADFCGTCKTSLPK